MPTLKKHLVEIDPAKLSVNVDPKKLRTFPSWKSPHPRPQERQTIKGDAAWELSRTFRTDGQSIIDLGNQFDLQSQLTQLEVEQHMEKQRRISQSMERRRSESCVGGSDEDRRKRDSGVNRKKAVWPNEKDISFEEATQFMLKI